MIVGSFTMHLYCENEGKYPDGVHEYSEFPHEYVGETRAECNRYARKDGWKLTRQRKAYCPKCKIPRKKEEE